MIGNPQGISGIVPVAVIGGFVIIPDVDPGVLLQSASEIWVRPVSAIDVPIVLEPERCALSTRQYYQAIRKWLPRCARGLIDKISQMDDEVYIRLLRQM